MLERRWKSQDHPLIMISFMLHPKYYSTLQAISKTSSLSLLQVSQYAVFYYKKFIGNEFDNLVGQVQKWYNNEVPAAQLHIHSSCSKYSTQLIYIEVSNLSHSPAKSEST